MNHLIILAALLAGCNPLLPFPDDEEGGGTAGEQLEPWQQGYLDIHQISTGRGNCTLMILPDGTTMVVDAGDLGSGTYQQEIMARVPSMSRTPGEWQVRYMQHELSKAGLASDHIDYLLATHFHSDHVGVPSNYSIPSLNGKYQMAGISYVANFMNVDLLLDRDYPDYNFPVSAIYSGDVWTNYRDFIKDREAKGGRMARFEAGRSDQLVLKKNPAAYPDFKVQNIYCNGDMWTGEGVNTVNIIPESDYLIDPVPSRLKNENLYSAVLKLSYGRFDYYSGGDALGTGDDNWYNIERQIAERVGEVDVLLCDHHAYSDAMNETFVKSSKAKVYIVPAWDYYHPQPEKLGLMLNESLYSGERMVFAAGLVGSNRIRLGADGEKIKPDGHVVVRVYPGGDQYQVFVLNDRTTTFDVIYKTDKIDSK